MEIQEKENGSAHIFTLKGRLDSTNSPEVEKKVLASIAADTKTIILNLSSLEYLSSAGMRLIVQCSKKLEKKGGHIYLVAVPKSIENILYITGFLPYFKMFDTEEEALKSP